MGTTPQDFTLPSALSNSKPKAAKRAQRGIGQTLLRVLGFFVAIALIATVAQFPGQIDPVGNRSVARPVDYADFYKRIYKVPSAVIAAPEKQDDAYVKIAREAIDSNAIVPRVADFVETYNLKNAHVLDVGSGTGYLQDIVENYVGLDISPTAARYYHKPFIEASATEIPLPDNEFDAVWTVWVLEHVPNPEQALVEMRRVTKDGGLLYLDPAWNADAWAADGYLVRPFSDFDFKGKLYKASYYPLSLPPVPELQQVFTRATLFLMQPAGPTRLHYRPLTPNYKEYWVADSDAINSLDRFEMSRWFTSRGDECLNCGDRFLNVRSELIIRVHKR